MHARITDAARSVCTVVAAQSLQMMRYNYWQAIREQQWPQTLQAEAKAEDFMEGQDPYRNISSGQVASSALLVLISLEAWHGRVRNVAWKLGERPFIHATSGLDPVTHVQYCT